MNEVGNDTSTILYKVRVNDQTATALFDTGVSMSVFCTRFFDSLKHKPKYYNAVGHFREAGCEALIPKGECFLQIKIGKQMFRDKVVMMNNLNLDYIIGTAIQRSYHVAIGFSITGRHFLSVNRQMVVQSTPPHTIK